MFVKPPHVPHQLAQDLLSQPRFARYLNASGGDNDRAMQLYAWNSDVSAAFHPPLGWLEISLRNSMELALRSHWGQDWYKRPDLPKRSRDKVEEALARSKKQPTFSPAEVSFGFWTGLLQEKCDELWRQCLHRAFAPGTRRRQLYKDLDHLRTFRNRIAHLEPIFSRDLAADFCSILSTATKIHRDLPVVLEPYAGPIDTLLAADPAPSRARGGRASIAMTRAR